MGSISHSDLEKADMSKRPKAKNPESDHHKDKHKIRFQFVTVETLEKHGEMSDEEVIFQKRVRVFHRVSKREKHLKPRGRRPSGFIIVFERLET